MSTPNLAIAHIQASQDQKEVTANAGFDALDLALTATLEMDCGAGGTISVSAADLRRHVRLVLAGSPGAGFTVELADVPRLLAVRNATDVEATLTNTAGNEAVAVPAGAELMIHSGPGGVTGVGAAGGGVYDFGAVAFAAPPPRAVIGKLVIPRAIVIPAGFAGARGHVDTPPAADWGVDVTRNGLSIGTITVATTGALVFATIAGAVVPVAPGDVIRFVADPRGAPAETAIAGFSVTIAAEVAQ
jgi:hypothetical protein